MVLLLIRPILFSFMQSNGVKKLLVDLSDQAYSEQTTDNTVDDKVA